MMEDELVAVIEYAKSKGLIVSKEYPLLWAKELDELLGTNFADLNAASSTLFERLQVWYPIVCGKPDGWDTEFSPEDVVSTEK